MDQVTLIQKEKMNPVTVCIFHVNRSNIVTNHSLPMCVTSGEHYRKGLIVFETIRKVLDAEDSILCVTVCFIVLTRQILSWGNKIQRLQIF